MAKKKMLLAVPEPECKKERTAPGRRRKEGQCPEEPSSKKLKCLCFKRMQIWNLRLHKKKVTHVEFNPRCDWLLATASVDQTVKIWDMRHIKDKNSFLHKLPHNKPVNSAHFNPTDGSKLLTTDQYDEIRVYSSADWSKPQHTIRHPHRHFQHLTSIKVGSTENTDYCGQ
ncbi:UNVERIFIED_CONTAM: hypothetical protein FKN15_013151 [Acipenser sinensis]